MEGGGRDKRLRGQTRLRDAEQQRLAGGGLAALLDRALVDLAEHELVHVLAFKELGVARLDDFHFLQHLAHDHADVLVVDLHALQPVHLLHFVQQVFLHGARALDPQNVVRIHRTLGQAVTGADAVALVHAQMLARGHFVQLRLALFRMGPDLALAALDLAEPHHAIDFGNRGRVLRPARLEQLGDARQAARDVTGLVRLARDLGEYLTRIHYLAILDHQLRAFRNHEVAEPLLFLALLLHDLDVRVQLLLAVFDDHALAPAGDFVQLLAHRLVLDDVDEPHQTRDVRHDRVRVRIPREQHAVLRYLLAVLDHQGRAERHLEPRVHRQLAAGGRSAGGVRRRLQHQLAFVARHDLGAVRRLDVRQSVAVLDHAFDLGLPHRLLGNTRRRAADVEGPQGQLRARLADRLRGQNADRFAEVHHIHRREVAPVAHAAHPALRFTRQHRADFHRLDPRILDGLRGLLDDQLPGLYQHLGPAILIQLVRIHHFLECDAAHNALAQRLDVVFAFLQPRHFDAEG